MVLVLSRQSFDHLTALGHKEIGIYNYFIQEIITHLGSEHASLFAKPNYYNNIVRWEAEGQHYTPWNKLSSSQQNQLLAAVQSILSDIRQITLSHPHTLLAQYFDQIKQIPSFEYIYAVDGKPVLTGWGYHQKDGAFVDLLDGYSDSKKRFMSIHGWKQFPWITSLLALGCGILASVIWHVSQHSEKVCYATYPLIKNVEEALKDKNQNQALTKKRDDLLKSLENLKKQCAVPPVQPLVPKDVPDLQPLPEIPKTPELDPIPDSEALPNSKPPQSMETPKPPPQPKQNVDLPKESWNKKDTSMLNGCWHLTTHLELYQRTFFSTSHQPVTNWTLCFKPNGAGRQVLTRRDGGTCTGPLNAQFQGNKLVLQQPTDCQGAFHLIPGKNVCTRLNDKEARCTYIDAEGHQSTGTFKR
ncbi:hypothetical protein [Commensalibacter oyaizuii]|uniref:Uncharacterized protein n=1 Tax=Commensalibacter oyaizuii TaxID=3043873 RepID=A0ABT6PZ94_9PROT|nr:hypothetical protein [Commensalibacter sp. TBRC 16381]MDI2090172.1 hypothetical protein [Commensalibacter sp. TBRC 16381]